MDFLKIYDTQLDNRNGPLLSLLHTKSSLISCANSINSTDTRLSINKPATLLPNFSFRITSFRIGQHVEYDIVLDQTYTVLRKTRSNQYKFKTRYSLIQALERKINIGGLPGKKLFGNKDPSFIEKRKGKLEAYLSRAVKQKHEELYKFIKQIKDHAFNQEMKTKINIE